MRALALTEEELGQQRRTDRADAFAWLYADRLPASVLARELCFRGLDEKEEQKWWRITNVREIGGLFAVRRPTKLFRQPIDDRAGDDAPIIVDERRVHPQFLGNAIDDGLDRAKAGFAPTNQVAEDQGGDRVAGRVLVELLGKPRPNSATEL